MNGKLIAYAAAAALAAASAACSQEATAPAPGTVTAIDAAAGTISLDHQAIPAISWPAMSMQFRAEDPAILAGIAVGDHVTFELKNASETSVITMVQKQ